MSVKDSIRVLLVEDSPSDLVLVRELFADSPDTSFKLEHTTRLADALRLLKEEAFDIVLLDLGLPDSQGVETFVKLHEQRPDVPIVVLTSSDDETTGEETIQGGAQDFLVKKQIQANLLRNSVRYSIMRTQVQHAQESERQRAEQSREMQGMDRLVQEPGTAVTARIYSGGPLREEAVKEYQAAVAEYSDVLDRALEQRLFRSDEGCSAHLSDLAEQLGLLRSGPRDVLDIHLAAIKERTEDVPTAKARAYIEEGRLTVLELMGYLTSYYRKFYRDSKRKETKP